jgi:hypothetical protein
MDFPVAWRNLVLRRPAAGSTGLMPRRFANGPFWERNDI